MKKFKIKKTATTEIKNYLIDYKTELNPQQYQAVTNINGPQLVIAGAGTGKTRTLIFRLAYLVENGINPKSILLLTFTRKSAQEMMRRAASILDERCINVSGGTYHSFANYILRKYALNIQMHPNFTILDRSDSEDVINLIRTQMGLNKKQKRFPRKHTLNDIISKSINKGISIEKLVLNDYPHYKKECDNIIQISKKFKEFKQQKQIMDYDDLLVNLKKLLEKNEDIRRKISNTYQYIMVDEYQDTNKLQGEITQLLASAHQNILVVGDDSQSIYSFRGATFRNIMDFPKHFPGTVITTLEKNYRSTRPILDLTNAVIEHAREKYSKELFSDINGIQKPIYIDTVDEHEQAALITQQILTLREEGIPLDKIAILFRASWHANELEVSLKSSNIPYVKYGGLKFAEAAHIKDVLSYLRVIHNVFDEIAWLRILLLLEGIGPTTASKIIHNLFQQGGQLEQLISVDYAKKKFFNDLKKLHGLITRLSGANLSPSEKLDTVIEYYTPFFELKYDDFRRRREDLLSLVRISERYSHLEQLLTEMVLEPPDNSQIGVETPDEEEEKLVLSTIHSAKGLEWHTVFIIHLVDGFFPSMQSIDSDDDIEEERRLFYVAATRAQNNLFLISPELESRSWHNFNASGFLFTQPSRFITEIPNFEELSETGIIEFEE